MSSTRVLNPKETGKRDHWRQLRQENVTKYHFHSTVPLNLEAAQNCIWKPSPYSLMKHHLHRIEQAGSRTRSSAPEIQPQMAAQTQIIPPRAESTIPPHPQIHFNRDSRQITVLGTTTEEQKTERTLLGRRRQRGTMTSRWRRRAACASGSSTSA